VPLPRPFVLPFAILLIAVAAPALAAPKAELWSRWLVHDAASAERIDHSAWDGFLAAHVMTGDDGVARLDYAAVAPAERAALAAYLERLAAVPIGSYSRPEQRAFWINLYNTLVVTLVLDNYPVDSILDIGFLSFGPWDRKLIAVDGEALSLNDIEHRILRPIWRDPRTHYAVNCASIGCPSLQPRAFTAENTEALLEAGARAYVNSPHGVRFEDGELIVSSIYDWFEEDFGGSEAGVLAHLRLYADPALRARLDGVEAIDGDDYDWSLNVKR
jgi:hypothetical protein